MKKRHLIGYPAVAVVALTLGVAASSGPTEPVTTPVATASPACRTALADADKVIHLGGQALVIAGDAFGQVAKFDVKAVEADNAKMTPISKEIPKAVSAYQDAKGACLK